MPELFIGLMSGTSMDAVDAVLVDFAPPTPHLLSTHHAPLPDEVREPLLRLIAGQSPHPLQCLGELDHILGGLFADAALTALSDAEITSDQVSAIGSHGQTVFHRPEGPNPFTIQIADPNVIAEQSGITTIADFRRRDIAAGGQGAPLVPAFHAAMLHSTEENRIVVNIGGMANVTLLPIAGPVSGFDTGPGNVLLDFWASRHLNTLMDNGGNWAAKGNVSKDLLGRMLSEPFFSRRPPKSTGRELFNTVWLEKQLAGFALQPEDVQATLGELTAQSIAEAIQQYQPDTYRVLVCGGGVHNTYLMTRLAEALPGCIVESTAKHGISPDWMEAMAFAWLAKQTLAGLAGNVPQVTGARKPVVLGGIYLGRVAPSP